MSTGPGDPPSAQDAALAAVEVKTGPTFEEVRGRERRLIFLLGTIVVVLALVGWLSIPSEEDLLQQAGESASNRERIEAMNTLVHRGYWAERPPAELRVYVSKQPEEVRQFMHRMHHRLMTR